MKVLSSIVLVLAIVGLSGVAALAEDVVQGAPKAKPLAGVLVKVAEDGKTLTLKVGTGDSAKEVAVKLGEKTAVEIDGKAAKLADLKAGMFLMVTPPEGVAEKIEATAGNMKH